VAHELGHFIDFLSPTPANKSLLALESTTDCFAILTLNAAGTTWQEIVDIMKSRQNSTTTHNTWNHIQNASTLNLKRL
jgi:hypothetical protein